MSSLGAIPILGQVIRWIRNMELVEYLKDQLADKDKQIASRDEKIEMLQNKLMKHYTFKSKGKK
jgi:hypothetical protein